MNRRHFPYLLRDLGISLLAGSILTITQDGFTFQTALPTLISGYILHIAEYLINRKK